MIRIENSYKLKKINVFFKILVIFKYIKYENLDINYYIHAYPFQCNILVYVVKNNKIVS